MTQKNWPIFLSLIISFFLSSFIYNFVVKKRPLNLSFNVLSRLGIKKNLSHKITPTITQNRSSKERFFLPPLSYIPTDKKNPSPTSSPSRINPPLKTTPLPRPTRITTPTNTPTCTNPQRGTYQRISVLQPNPEPISKRRDLYLSPHYQVNVELKVLNIPIYDPDPNVPLLYTIFNPPKTPRFITAYKAEGEIQGDHPPAVDILEVETTPNENLYFPKTGYNIGDNLAAMVLYADENRITFKVGREDSCVTGYTLYFENLCVDKNLINLYQQLNSEGRKELPAIYQQQFFGLTKNKLKIALRDTGMFLDLRINGVVDDYKIWR